MRGVLEVHDVQRRGKLVKIVAVAPQNESEQRTEQQADGRLVRHHEHIRSRVCAHDFDQHGERPRRGIGELDWLSGRKARQEGIFESAEAY